MRIEALALPEVLRLLPELHRDARGCFLETWRAESFAAAGLDLSFVQDNLSVSEAGVLRGLHYQLQRPQGKLVRCVRGRVFDVAVDLRRPSPSFGRWVGCELDDREHAALWVPPGFAHGFLVLEGPATVSYRCTETYDPDSDRAVAWDDPDIAVDWPLDAPPLLSARDAAAPGLAEAAVYEALP